MATRNIVPRATGEGSLGTSAKHWGNIYADNGTIAGRNIANDGAMLTTHEAEITNLQNQVTTLEHAYAGAKAAATVADMTDHNQIYVYVGSETGYTNGNWYYWNGTAWTSGGVYNATALETDKTLTISGAAADAKITGTVREAVDNFFTHNFVNIMPPESEWNSGYLQNGVPTTNENYIYTNTYIPVSGYSTIIGSKGFAFVSFYDAEKTHLSSLAFQATTVSQKDIPTNAVYMRFSFSKSMKNVSSFVCLCSLEQYYEGVSNGVDGLPIKVGRYAAWNNGDSNHSITDANDVKYNSVYLVQGSAGTKIENLPSSFENDGNQHLLITFSCSLYANGDYFSCPQLLYSLNGKTKYFRSFSSVDNAWSSWIEIPSEVRNNKTAIFNNGNVLQAPITDADDAENNTTYIVQGAVGSSSIDNLPDSWLNDGNIWQLFTEDYDIPSGTIRLQTFKNISLKNGFIRQIDQTLWQPIEGSTIHCGIGQQFTTLKSAIAMAIRAKNVRVVVHPGTYNLNEEFADEINAATDTVGIRLDNNIYVEFMSGSYVTVSFEASNSWAHAYFNPFYSNGNGSFTLDSLHIYAKNSRYCVHDEHNGVGTYHHVYKNCVMEFENTVTNPDYVQCIGGGLGEHGYICIEGGYYKSTPTVPSPVLDNSQIPISFHNGNNANADSKIFISNVMLADDGYFKFGYYGPSTIKSQVFINNCNMGYPTLLRAENSSATSVNFEIIEWNNTVVNQN